MGYSFPYGVPLIIYPLLLIGAGCGHAWAGLLFQGIFFAGIIYFLIRL